MYPYGYNFVLLYRIYTLSGAKLLFFFELTKFFRKILLINCIFAYFPHFFCTKMDKDGQCNAWLFILVIRVKFLIIVKKVKWRKWSLT